MKDKKKVLIIDDDANALDLIQRALTKEGFKVHTAASGKEALAEIGKDRPDLVIMDISMPGMDGIEALGKVLGVDNTIPVILNTAYANYRDNFLSWAADAYVVKSSDLSLLRETVAKILG